MLQGYSAQNRYKLKTLEAAQVQVPSSGYWKLITSTQCNSQLPCNKEISVNGQTPKGVYDIVLKKVRLVIHLVISSANICWILLCTIYLARV